MDLPLSTVRYRLTRTVLAQLCIVTLVTGQVRADDVVVPNSYETVEGATNNSWPFDIGSFGFDSMRYQQVFDASQFGSVSGPVLITQISFRPDEMTGGVFDSVLPDIQINLSTTASSPDNMSLIFSENIGPDDTVVHNGPLALSSNFTGPGPKDFDIVITLSNPFLYDPAAGNLLMDVRNYGGGETTTFDSLFDFEDASGRATTGFVGDITSEVADFTDNMILVTKFTFGSSDSEPTVIPILVDIKPGDDANTINLNLKEKKNNNSQGNAGGVLNVAVLSTESYDASLTDVGSIVFGDPGLAEFAFPLKSSFEDVDEDGDLDLVLQFGLREMLELGALDLATTELMLSGQTLTGDSISGSDFVTLKVKLSKVKTQTLKPSKGNGPKKSKNKKKSKSNT